MIKALVHLHNSVITDTRIPTILIGDFNINIMQDTTDERSLKKTLIKNRGYIQLVNHYTTDYRTQMDHIYITVPQLEQSS